MRHQNNKEAILKAGWELFAKQGFAATGVQEIATKSGVPKGSFYNHFDSKEAFAVEIIRRYADRLGAFLDEKLLQGEGTPLFRLRQLFDDWTEDDTGIQVDCGCLVGNLTQELANHTPELRLVLQDAFDRLQSRFTACLYEARGAGEIADGEDIETLSAFIYNAWQGALVRAKAQQDTVAFKSFLEVVFSRVLS
ncbi:MAG: TetR family transcriptional regulator C-terminal domain-containing protein [Planctomycetota bacterium]